MYATCMNSSCDHKRTYFTYFLPNDQWPNAYWQPLLGSALWVACVPYEHLFRLISCLIRVFGKPMNTGALHGFKMSLRCGSLLGKKLVQAFACNGCLASFAHLFPLGNTFFTWEHCSIEDPQSVCWFAMVLLHGFAVKSINIQGTKSHWMAIKRRSPIQYDKFLKHKPHWYDLYRNGVQLPVSFLTCTPVSCTCQIGTDCSLCLTSQALCSTPFIPHGSPH